MNYSLAATTERQPQRPCGCVGILFQLFDQNRRFACFQRNCFHQQALPVEDGFSVSYFLNEHEMVLSFLWMAFGELLGCNDLKQMNQLKGFASVCLLEYLDSKFSPISDSGFRTYSKLPSYKTKVILIADIIDEVKEWTQFVGLIPDELIE
ncbi:hypothetical protein CQW23_30251 [Capsicum baccatum]|uniref:Uncharacterized protein n=1 Tax=Capsicum baccatum TaxID=33114 RepID=A0A2G2VAY3_CAPBA|nr:hypothetical protein CQW23_30251 [Capsicum baccatum]